MRSFSRVCGQFCQIILFVFISTTSLHADEHKTVVSWLKQLETLGLQTSYERLETNGPITRLVNPKLNYEGTFKFSVPQEDGTRENVSVQLNWSMRAAHFEFDSLTEDAHGYRMRAFKYSDDAQIVLSMSATPAPSGTNSDPFEISAQMAIIGNSAEDIFAPKFVALPKDNLRPLARYVSFVKEAMRASVGRSSIDRIELQVIQPGGKQTTIYKDIAINQMADGKISEYRVGSVEQTAETSQPHPTPGADAEPLTLNIKTSYVDAVTRDLDMGRILDFFTGTLTDPDYKPVMSTSHLRDLSITTSSSETPSFSFSVDRIHSDGFLLRGSPDATKKGIAPIDFYDSLLAGDDLDPDKIMGFVFGMFSAFKIEKMGFEDMRGKIDGISEFGMANLSLEGLSTDGLDLVSVNNVNWNGEQDRKFTLGQFRIGDMVFPNLRGFFELSQKSEGGQVDPAMAVKLLSPQIGLISVGDLMADGPDMPPMTLASLDVGQKNFVGVVPSDISFTTKDLIVPVSVLESPVAKFLDQLGLNAAKLNAGLDVRWDENSQDLIIERLATSMQGGGSFEFSARFGGVPRAVLENPQQGAAMLMGTLTLKSLHLSIDDAALARAALETMAAEQGISVEEVRAGLLAQLDSAPPPVQLMLENTAFGRDLKQALTSFLSNYKHFELHFEPENAVPVTQIVGLAATSPQAIPELLGASVSGE